MIIFGMVIRKAPLSCFTTESLKRDFTGRLFDLIA